MEPRMLRPLTALLLLASGGSNAAEDRLPLEPSLFVTAKPFDESQSGATFADAAGQLWLVTSGRRMKPPSLLKWDGQTRSWEETPVQVERRPVWGARKAPPWVNWARPPIAFFAGRNGALLAVVSRDVYQLIPNEDFYQFGTPEVTSNWRSILQQGDQLAAERGRYFWLEAWLYRDRKWSERTMLADLLKAQQAYFVENFTEQTTAAQFFDLQVVGSQLWWTEGLDVHVLDSTGKMATYRPPRVEGQQRRANLVLLPDNTLWGVLPNVMVFKLVEGVIEAESLPEMAYNSGYRCTHVARDGRIWVYGGKYLPPSSLREGEWVPERGLGPFIFENPDGGMWFMPGGGEGTHSAKGYNILKGGERFRLPLPGHFYKGVVTAAGKDILLAAGGDRILTIVRSEEEPGWAVRGVLGVRDAYVAGPVWLDGHGNLLSTGWSAKLPDGRLP